MKTHDTNRKQKLLSLLLAFLGTGLGGLALADHTDTIRFAAELDSCVTAVTERLDLDNVDRVRHTVIEERHSGLGFALSIRTSVFTDGAERRYVAYCVANGAGAPLKFRMDERVG